MKKLKQEYLDKIDEIVAKHKDEKGPMKLMLHEIQNELGYIPFEAMEKISETINENKQEEEIYELENINKIKDNYSAGRNILAQKLPDNIKEYKDYLFILPDLVSLIYRLLKDKRIPIKTKLVMSAAVAYVMFPSDLIPNNIPFIGVIDDIGVIFFALNRVVSDVPLSLIVENWEGSNDIIIVMKNGLEYLTNFTAATNVEKLYEFVEELSTL